MQRSRQVLAALTVLGIVALATCALWTPTQKVDLVIAPSTGPVR